jgi:hypothetical protein
LNISYSDETDIFSWIPSILGSSVMTIPGQFGNALVSRGREAEPREPGRFAAPIVLVRGVFIATRYHRPPVFFQYLTGARKKVSRSPGRCKAMA